MKADNPFLSIQSLKGAALSLKERVNLVDITGTQREDGVEGELPDDQ